MIFDGNRILIRQSWLDTFMRCPERARLVINHPVAGTSDSAALGTGAHAGCEAILLGGSKADAQQAIVKAIQIESDLGIKWTHPDNEYPQNIGHMIVQADKCFDAWLDEIYPELVKRGWLGQTPEQKFEVKLFDLPDGREVWLTGTADLPTPQNVIVDWKTSKRPYKQWDKQRHAIQPTIYTWAATLGAFEGDHYRFPMEFVYGVMIRPLTNLDGNYRTELIPVRREEAHARWAMKQITAALTQAITVGFDTPWPMIAEGNFLCSAKWCDHYHMCRGNVLDARHDQKVELT